MPLPYICQKQIYISKPYICHMCKLLEIMPMYMWYMKSLAWTMWPGTLYTDYVNNNTDSRNVASSNQPKNTYLWNTLCNTGIISRMQNKRWWPWKAIKVEAAVTVHSKGFQPHPQTALKISDGGWSSVQVWSPPSNVVVSHSNQRWTHTDNCHRGIDIVKVLTWKLMKAIKMNYKMWHMTTQLKDEWRACKTIITPCNYIRTKQNRKEGKKPQSNIVINLTYYNDIT